MPAAGVTSAMSPGCHGRDNRQAGNQTSNHSPVGIKITMTERQMTKALHFALLMAVFLLGMGLRLYQLDTDSLWLDEVKTVLTSRLDLVSMLDFQAEESVHPPLLYIITRFFLALFGSSDFVVRLQATLLGSLSLLLTYKLGEMLWTPREGVIGAFLLAINAYHIRYSQEARHYGLMVFLALLSLIFLLKALQSGRKRMWILFGLCAGLNIYTHYFAFLILAGELLFAAWVILRGWVSSQRERQQTNLQSTSTAGPGHRSVISADPSPPTHSPISIASDAPSPRMQAFSLVAVLAVLAVSYLPWLPFMYQQLIGRHIEFEGLGEGTLPRAELSIAFFHDALRTYTRVDGALLFLFLALFALGLARSRARHIVLFGLWIMTPFLFPFVVRASHFFTYRYAVYIVPILLLGMARGISVLTGWLTGWLPKIKDHQRWRLAITSVLTVSVFGAISVAPIRDYYAVQKVDYRGVAGYLAQRLLPGDILVTDGFTYRTDQDSDWTERCLSYYMGFHGPDDTPILLVQRGFWANLRDVAESDGEISAVLGRRWKIASWDQETDVTVVDFEDLSVIHLRQPTGDLFKDAVSMLEALARLLRMPDAQFDVRLALAEAYAQMGRELDAGSQIVLASTVMPDDERAVADLAAARAQLQPSLDIQLVEMTLGDSLSLPGYNIRPTSLKAGDTVSITLWWQADVRMETDYTAFVHIRRPDGQMLVQEDTLLRSGNRPTSRWSVGEVVRDEHQLVLPSDAEPGQYLVTTGVYYWKTGERLPVWDGSGRRLADDVIILVPEGET